MRAAFIVHNCLDYDGVCGISVAKEEQLFAFLHDTQPSSEAIGVLHNSSRPVDGDAGHAIAARKEYHNYMHVCEYMIMEKSDAQTASL